MAYSIQSVFKGAAIYTIGQFFTKAFGFFLIPIYTRFLTPSDYGIIGYLQVVLQLISTILMFGFYGAQTRYYYEFKEDKKKLGIFLFSINFYLFNILLVLCFTLSYFGDTFYSLFKIKNITFYPYLPIVIWTSFFQILNQMVISFYLATKQYKKCAWLQFVQFALMTGIVILFIVYFKEGAIGKLKGHLFGQILFTLLFYIGYAKNFTWRFNKQYLRYALSFGVPIVFHLLAGVMHNSIDRFILEKFVSLEQLGIYTLGYQIGMLMSIVVISVNRAWQPNYFEFMSTNDNIGTYFENRRALAFWITFIGTLCIAGIMWAKEFVILLTPPTFHNSAGIVPIIIFGYFFQGLYFFAGSPIFYFKKTKFMPFLTGSAAFLNIILNLLFIPSIGIYGAAIATLISYIFMSIVVYVFGKRLYNPHYEIKILAILIIIIGSSFVLSKIEASLLNELYKLSYILLYIALSIKLYKPYFTTLAPKSM